MAKPRESSDTVKERILKVARDLFAQRGINGVGIREIAAAAGISHTLVIRYFGSKSAIVNEILRREISVITRMPPPTARVKPVEGLAAIRTALLSIMDNQNDTMKLIMRAGLDGLFPETFVDPNSRRAANMLASWVEFQQKGEPVPDPKITSLLITGAMFSLASISPWLMTSVGLPKEDFEKRKEDIADVLIWFLVQAAGLPDDTVNSIKRS